MSDLLPLFLKLEGRTVLLVGGGPVAAAKAEQLHAAGARLRVVAPEISSAVAQLATERHARKFVPQDLDGVWLVVSAAPSEVNTEVALAAEARGLFVNTVDQPEQASAYFGSLFRRGGVTVAVGSSGRAPALVALLRRALESVLPEDLERWVETAERLRQEQRDAGVPMDERRPQLLDALVKLYGEEK